MEEQCIVLTEDLTNWLYEEKLKWRIAGYRYVNPSAINSVEELMSTNTLYKGASKSAKLKRRKVEL